jgi:hypothetical protein
MSLQDLQAEAPFSYKATKSGSVQIFYESKTVSTLSGREAAKFLAKVEATDSARAQLVMAKATGHFKHGTGRAQRRSNDV